VAASKTTSESVTTETKTPTSEPEGTEATRTETTEPATTSQADPSPGRLEKETPQAEMEREIQATGEKPATTADMPDVPITHDPRAHGPSSQGQASAAEQTLAVASDAAFPRASDVIAADQRAEADDNEIERTTRAMAAAGHSAGEIAAYRAEAFARLGD
jgi:hypothetical protein